MAETCVSAALAILAPLGLEWSQINDRVFVVIDCTRPTGESDGAAAVFIEPAPVAGWVIILAIRAEHRAGQDAIMFDTPAGRVVWPAVSGVFSDDELLGATLIAVDRARQHAANCTQAMQRFVERRATC